MVVELRQRARGRVPLGDALRDQSVENVFEVIRELVDDRRFDGGR
jgi:hypothetical protein